jgi:iron complex transport system substrate-binding protein
MKNAYKLLLAALALTFALTACGPAATPPLETTSTPAPAPTEIGFTPTATTAPTAAPSATPAPTATAAPSATPAAISVPDGLGGTLTFAEAPKHIVSLAPSNAEVLFAIGAGSQMAAREDFTNFPAEAAKLPSVGGMAGPVSVEQIVSFKPDLVMVAPISAPELIKGLQDLKIPVMLLPNPKTLADMYANLVLVGKLTGHSKEAADLVTSLQAREKKILAVAAKASSKPTVFYELDGTDPAKPWTSGPGTFVDLLISLAGGKNIGASLQGEWAQLSQEALLVQNPDLIVLGDANFGMTADKIKARAGWDALKAVKEGKIVPFNDDLISRPGPRMLDGLEELVKAIHPELAAELK